MEDDKDIVPPADSSIKTEIDNDQVDNSVMINVEEFDPATLDPSSVPLYEDLVAVKPRAKVTKETVEHYSGCLENVPLIEIPSTDLLGLKPVFAAPSVTQAKNNILDREFLMTGVRVSIPRSNQLWAGDQLRLRWGTMTFYSPIGEPKGRGGPREVRYLSGALLGRSKHGLVEVSYEVHRRARLVGVSQSLVLTLVGKCGPAPRSRLRFTRRRKRPE